MAISLPYVQAHSNISKVLEKIKNASLPPRFTARLSGYKAWHKKQCQQNL